MTSKCRSRSSGADVRVALCLAAVLLVSAARARPPTRKPDAGSPTPSSAVAPLGPGETVGWSHAPYEDGNCALCHERSDPKSPGKITMPVNELCFSCHEDVKGLMDRRAHRHSPAKKDCTLCHNPHNAPARKLLVKELTSLCFGCHEPTQKDVQAATVVHLPVTEGDQCMNCHNPHASNIDQLLRFPPYELCVTCHGLDDVRDTRGVKLANIKRVLDEGQVKHGAIKDCTACHVAHGSPNFRLLVDPYPGEFYASFDPKNYALCFECHKPDIVREASTTTLTRFRDGSKNLHFVHVNREDRGRTCRACHETHAAHQRHLIRDAVPYGPKGWLLEVNFKPLPDGGECARTCHPTRRYSNTAK